MIWAQVTLRLGVTGVNDTRWPLRGRPNPLLPQRLQRALNMPWAHADYSRRKAEQMIDRLASTVPDLRLSWAQTADGEACGPAAILAPFLGASPDSAGAVLDIAAIPSPDVRQASAEMEQVDDSMAARAHVKRLSGGASLLNLQASCPLRAFIDYRLHAGEVQRRTRGISRALRGQILHRAAAELMKPGTRSEELPEHASGNWATDITAAAQRALRREFGGAFEWFSELIRFEQQRLELTLNQLLATEARRTSFVVRAVEDDVRLIAHDVELRARVDRIDELASGGYAIIDYKTGTTGTIPYWFDSEHADYQLPLYAVAAQQDVSALVLCSLNPERVGYRGFWLDSEAFPQRSIKRLTENEWRDQVTGWRHEIDALISGFIAGDNRIFAENSAPALGMYAPLTRLSEYLATGTDELME